MQGWRYAGLMLHLHRQVGRVARTVHGRLDNAFVELGNPLRLLAHLNPPICRKYTRAILTRSAEAIHRTGSRHANQSYRPIYGTADLYIQTVGVVHSERGTPSGEECAQLSSEGHARLMATMSACCSALLLVTREAAPSTAGASTVAYHWLEPSVQPHSTVPGVIHMTTRSQQRSKRQAWHELRHERTEQAPGDSRALLLVFGLGATSDVLVHAALTAVVTQLQYTMRHPEVIRPSKESAGRRCYTVFRAEPIHMAC